MAEDSSLYLIGSIKLGAIGFGFTQLKHGAHERAIKRLLAFTPETTSQDNPATIQSACTLAQRIEPLLLSAILLTLLTTKDAPNRGKLKTPGTDGIGGSCLCSRFVKNGLF